MRSYRSIFLCVISAALLVHSFPEPNFWVLAWFALIPLFLAIRDKTFINAFLLGFFAGLIFFYGAIYWLNSIAPIATIALVFYLSLYFALFGLFAKFVFQAALPVFCKALLVASGWVALEFIRSNFLTGFGWALLGYSQSSFLPAIQIADITGAYGVSFLVVFVNAAIYEFLFESSPRVPLTPGPLPTWERERVRGLYFTTTRLMQNRLINFICSFLLVTGIFIYGFYKLNKEIASSPFASLRAPRNDGCVPIKISLIQGNIPQPLKWDASYKEDIIKKYFRLTLAAGKDDPDLIIWPESSFPADFQAEPELAGQLFELARQTNVYLLVGANRFVWSRPGYEYEKVYNSAFLITPDGAIKQYYDKLHLVPFGEYMPRVPNPLLKILPEKINMVGDFSAGEKYTVFGLRLPLTQSSFASLRTSFSPQGRGIKGEGVRNDTAATFSVLICFEDVFPELSREFVRKGANFLVNITNDGWYGISSAPFQHAQASVFRAVENRVFVVRAANTGLSVFIDRNGRVFDGVSSESGQKIFIEGYKTGVISQSLSSSATTFYNRYGDVFAIACLVVFAISIGFSRTQLGKSKV
jgi:apolipoprotein N-acyltransferase